MNGRFGPYVQLGEQGEGKKAAKPKRASLFASMSASSVSMYGFASSTVQAAPIAVGARGNSSELVSFAGRTLPSISPTQLKQLLTGSALQSVSTYMSWPVNDRTGGGVIRGSQSCGDSNLPSPESRVLVEPPLIAKAVPSVTALALPLPNFFTCRTSRQGSELT
jgi:hypothetical protein